MDDSEAMYHNFEGYFGDASHIPKSGGDADSFKPIVQRASEFRNRILNDPEGVIKTIRANTELQALFDSQGTHIRWLERLDSKIDKAVVFRDLLKQYPTRFQHIDLERISDVEVRDAKRFIEVELGSLSNKLNDVRSNGSARKLFAGRKADTPEILEQGPSWVSRNFNRAAHNIDQYLNNKTLGQKLLIAGASTVVGSTFAYTGTSMFFQGVDGREPQYEQLTDGSVLAVTKPMSPSKRATKILAGAAMGITGVAAQIFGFVSLYKAFLSH